MKFPGKFSPTGRFRIFPKMTMLSIPAGKKIPKMSILRIPIGKKFAENDDFEHTCQETKDFANSQNGKIFPKMTIFSVPGIESPVHYFRV